MHQPNPAELSAWRAQMQRAQSLVNEGQFDEAQAIFSELWKLLAAAGVKSAHLLWGLGVVADYRCEFEAALCHLEEAMRLDPLGLPYANSHSVVVSHLRSELCREERTPCDPAIPRLYALLLERGEVDLASHLVMGGHLSHTGKHAEALQLLEAVVLLHPASAQAWAALEVAARAAGNTARAEEARLQGGLTTSPRSFPSGPGLAKA